MFIEMEKYNEYEELGITLVVVKQKNYKKISIIVAIILAILFCILIYVSSIHNKMLAIQEDVNLQAEVGQDILEEVTQNDTKLPVLTQKGRDNMTNIYKSEQKIAYLTFDDGPSKSVTPQILNILDQYNIKATFFVLGCNVDKNPDIVRQSYEKGHYIANHGYSHVYENIYASSQAVLDEFNRTEQSVRNAIGVQEYSGHIFRFPGGSMGKKYRMVKDEAKILLSNNDILCVDWNALTNDSVGKPTAESIVNDLKTTVGTKNTVVILMHDTGSKQLTVDTLPQILDYLIEQGYTFRTFYDVIC